MVKMKIGDKIGYFNTLAYATKPHNGSVYIQEDSVCNVKINSTAF